MSNAEPAKPNEPVASNAMDVDAAKSVADSVATENGASASNVQESSKQAAVPSIPNREFFFKVLDEAIKENNKLKGKDRSLVIGYFEQLLKTPAFKSEKIDKPFKRLTKPEARRRGEELVEQFIVSRMPEFAGAPLEQRATGFDEKLEEQLLIASELLHRKHSFGVVWAGYNGLPLPRLKPVINIKNSDGNVSGPVMERRVMDRRQAITNIIFKANLAVASGTMAISTFRQGAFELMVPNVSKEHDLRREALNKKLKAGEKITEEDINTLAIDDSAEAVRHKTLKNIWNLEKPEGAIMFRFMVSSMMAGYAVYSTLQNFVTFKGVASNRSVHEHAKILLEVGRKLDSQVRGLYERLPEGPSILPPDSDVPPRT